VSKCTGTIAWSVSRCAPLVFITCMACGGSPATPVAPSQPAPTALAAPVLSFSLRDATAGLRVLPDKPPAVTYTSCRGIQNIGPATLTVTYEMEVMDANGAVYPTFSFPSRESTLNPFDGLFGCGGDTVYDFDFSHPVATRYRLRVRYRDGTVSGLVEETAGVTQILNQLPPRVVINEFRTRGPGGPTDQFIELFNDSLTASTASASLCSRLVAPSETRCVEMPPITIGPLCHYLITAPGYSGRTRGDLNMTAFLLDDGYFFYRPGFDPSFNQSLQVDTVAMHVPVASVTEGAPLAPFGPENSDRGYTRVGTDTNDNSRDFVMRAPSSPQNSSSCGSR
jgi:hypothetical protein